MIYAIQQIQKTTYLLVVFCRLCYNKNTMNIKTNKNQIQQYCKDNQISYLGLFGSHARNEQTPQSDIDLLVDYKQPKSLFTLGKILCDLEEMLGKKVDLVNRQTIKPMLKPYIDKDLITLYKQN